jgi:hypothetical protein
MWRQIRRMALALPPYDQAEILPSMYPHIAASQAYASRFRGAPPVALARDIPYHTRHKNAAISLSLATYESMLLLSATWRSTYFSEDKSISSGFSSSQHARLAKCLRAGPLATERSMMIHAAVIERMVQTGDESFIAPARALKSRLVRAPSACSTPARRRDDARAQSQGRHYALTAPAHAGDCRNYDDCGAGARPHLVCVDCSRTPLHAQASAERHRGQADFRIFHVDDRIHHLVRAPARHLAIRFLVYGIYRPAHRMALR